MVAISETSSFYHWIKFPKWDSQRIRFQKWMNFLASLQAFPNIQFAYLKKKTFSMPKWDPAGFALLTTRNLMEAIQNVIKKMVIKIASACAWWWWWFKPGRRTSWRVQPVTLFFDLSLSLPNSTKAVEPWHILDDGANSNLPPFCWNNCALLLLLSLKDVRD